jgi:hypothetical protein
MSLNNRDKARRFITLLDELYNARCRLVVCAAAPPDTLFQVGCGLPVGGGGGVSMERDSLISHLR